MNSDQSIQIYPLVADNRINNSIVKKRFDGIFTLSFFFIILLSGSVQSYDIRALALMNAFLQIWLFYRISFKISRRLQTSIYLIFFYLIYSLAITTDAEDLLYIAFRFYDIFAAFSLLNYWLIRKPDFEKTFFYVLMFFFIHGTLGFVLSNSLSSLYSPIIVEGVYAGAQLSYLFFFPHEPYLGLQRSQGLFWEPGVYQIYLNILLFYCAFYKRSMVLSVLVLGGVLSTMSTTGLAIALAQVLVFAGMHAKLSVKGIVMLIVMVLSLPFLILLTFNNIDDKLNGERAGSSWARSFDTLNGMSVAANNPLGIGFNPLKYQAIAAENPFKIETPLQTDRGQTNGIVMLFYSSGFFWAFVLLYCFFKNRVFYSKSWLFNCIVFVSLLTEPVLFSPFFFLFVLAGLVNKTSTYFRLSNDRPSLS